MRELILRGKSFQRILSVVLLVNILCDVLPPAAAQTKRDVTTRKTSSNAATKRNAATPAEEKVDLTKFIPPDKGKTMSAAYDSGVLPAPAALPAGTVEEQASLLAEAVAAGDENSVPALITALKAAGYGIRDAEGNVDYQSGWQGLALDGWQVAAMARSYGNGVGIGLGTFGDGLEIIAPEWKKETNAADLVNGIRRATRSEHSSLRFWGNFIIELGRRTNVPYNLLNDEDVKHARLDVVQMSLIMTRLAADLNFAARRVQQSERAKVEPNEFDQRNESNRKDGAAAYFVNASYRTGDQSQNIDAQARAAVFTGASYKLQNNAADDLKMPCTTSEMESLILDVNATGMGYLYGEFVDYLENKNVVPKKTGAMYDKANAVLTVMKLIATYAALDTEVTMDGEQMLTRTKKTQPGETKTLTAKVKIDVGKWQAMNCVRPALNAAGLDFSLPNDGALAGTRVDWNLLEGSAGDSANSIVAQVGNLWYTVKNIPKVVVDGTMEIGDAIVFLDKRVGTEPGDKKYYNYTDANGESKMNAVGMRQKRDLSKENVRPVMKKMSVNLDIQIKTMRLKDKTAAAGTANDLAGNAIAFFTKDVPGFVAGTAAETVYRSNLGSSKTVTFPVKDWMPCTGGWNGTVTYRRVKVNDTRRTFEYDSPIQAGQDVNKKAYHSHFWRDLVQDDGLIKVKTEANASGKYELKAEAFLVSQESRYHYALHKNQTNCRGTELFDFELHRINTTNGTAYGHGEAESFQIFVNDNTARISFKFPTAVGTWHRESNSFYKTSCPTKTDPPYKSQWENKVEDIWHTVENIPLDPKNPYVLKGNREIPGNRPGEGIRVEWDLARCN
jgi:hypothetical protein